MLAKDLAKLLMVKPDAEVIISSLDYEDQFKCYSKPCILETDNEVNIPEVWSTDILERPDEVFVISEGICIGHEIY